MANKIIKLKSYDGKIFEIEESVAIQSNTIQQMTQVVCADDAVPLQITSEILIKVIEFCKRHFSADEKENSGEPSSSSSSDGEEKNSGELSSSSADEEEENSGELSSSSSSSPSDQQSEKSLSSIEIFDKNFVKVDWELLKDLMIAANYLDIKDLLDLTCQAAADIIKDKRPEEIRILLNMENDFTPEEEEQIRAEHPWVFE